MSLIWSEQNVHVYSVFNGNTVQFVGAPQPGNSPTGKYEYVELRNSNHSKNLKRKKINEESLTTHNIMPKKDLEKGLAQEKTHSSSAPSNQYNFDAHYQSLPSKFLTNTQLTKLQELISTKTDATTLSKIEEANSERLQLFSSLICACGHVSSIHNKLEHENVCEFSSKH